MKTIKILLASFFVIVVSAAVYSFTANSTTRINDSKEEKNKIERQTRVRYCINLTCAQQSVNRALVLQPSSYSQPCAIECPGALCVCAIMAFEDEDGNPIIDETADPELYNQLNDFVDDGIWQSPSPLVQKKSS